MTIIELTNALQGRKIRWGQSEPYKWHSIDTIIGVKIDPAYDAVRLYIGLGEFLTLALRDAEALATKGRCTDGTFSYSLRKEKEGKV